MCKSISKKRSNNLSGKYSQKLHHSKQSALETTSKRVVRKTVEAAGDIICNKITIN